MCKPGDFMSKVENYREYADMFFSHLSFSTHFFSKSF